jgi:hypothetical protein
LEYMSDVTYCQASNVPFDCLTSRFCRRVAGDRIMFWLGEARRRAPGR